MAGCVPRGSLMKYERARIMQRPFRIVALALLLIGQFGWGQSVTGNQAREPETFFRNFAGLADDQIRDIREGRAVAKALETPVPDEVIVFGAVYINSTPERYLKLASDLDSLRKIPSFLALRRFSDPPQIADLDGFNLDEKDINELQHCTPGHCEVQLPMEAMDEFQRSVNWSAPDRAAQANRLARQLALQALLRYQQGGNAGLRTLRDKSHPTVVGETFASMLRQMKALPVYLPELERYLLDYPKAASDQIRSEFYWEKLNFGLKPTLRLVQAVTYHGSSPTKPAYVVAVKQLYASHYFETALDVTACVRDTGGPENGFYLITLKGSQQAGLTGFKGGILRKVAVSKTRSSLEKALAAYKQKLEAQTN